MPLWKTIGQEISNDDEASRMMKDWEKQRELDRLHAKCPEPGDYWEEMICPIARVLMVDDTHVLIQKLAGYGGHEINRMDPKPVMMTRRSFKRWLSYGSIPGTWAHVHPRHLVDAA